MRWKGAQPLVRAATALVGCSKRWLGGQGRGGELKRGAGFDVQWRLCQGRCSIAVALEQGGVR